MVLYEGWAGVVVWRQRRYWLSLVWWFVWVLLFGCVVVVGECGVVIGGEEDPGWQRFIGVVAWDLMVVVDVLVRLVVVG